MSYPPTPPSGGQPPYGDAPQQPPYGGPPNQPPYGGPPQQPPYGGPPQQPPYGQPYPQQGGWHPGHAPRRGGRGWLIALIIFLALVAVGAILWATGALDEVLEDLGLKSRSSSYSSSYTPYSSTGNTATSTYGTNMSSSTYGSNMATTSTTGSVTRSWLAGTWGAGCPSSRAGSVTLNSDGTISSPGGTATWVLVGNQVTTYSGGRSETSTWTYLSPTSASVTVPGIGTRNLYRCSGTTM